MNHREPENGNNAKCTWSLYSLVVLVWLEVRGWCDGNSVTKMCGDTRVVVTVCTVMCPAATAYDTHSSRLMSYLFIELIDNSFRPLQMKILTLERTIDVG